MIFFQNDCILVLIISLLIIFSSQFRNNFEERYGFHNPEESWNKKHGFEADIEAARQRLKREAQNLGTIKNMKERTFKKHTNVILPPATHFITSDKFK